MLSLFPGLGLLDRAFEEAGCTVVRGPDKLWGGDVRGFRVPADRFDGVIGGPPCQFASSAGEILGSEAVDLIPEYVRLVNEARPTDPRRQFFSVMENVALARKSPAIPRAWHPAKIRDYDVGGETSRTRFFWTWPFMVMEPARRPGDASHAVMASTAKRGSGSYCDDKGFLRGDLPLEEYERLQGCPGATAELVKRGASRSLCVHLLGNGVPLAMGRYIAGESVRWWHQAVAA